MKAKTIIHLQGGDSVKVSQDIDQIAAVYAQNFAAGSAIEFQRVTDHGTAKRVYIPPGQISRIEET